MPFTRGKSGNPAGPKRGKKRISPESGRAWALQHLDASNKVMLELMRDPNADPGVRLRAALAVQERAWGKVPQVIEGNIGLTPGTVAELMAQIRGDAP